MVVEWELKPDPVPEMLLTTVRPKSGRENVKLMAAPGPSGLVCVLDASTTPRELISVARIAKLGTVLSSSRSRAGRNELPVRRAVRRVLAFTLPPRDLSLQII